MLPLARGASASWSLGILAVVNKVTTAPIAEAEMRAKVEAIRAVAPAFDNNPFAEKLMVLPEGETDSLTVYPAKKGSALVGFAIESYTQKGFSGLIRVMVGFDAEGRLVDFSVLQHSESPASARVSPSGTTRRVRRAAYVTCVASI